MLLDYLTLFAIVYAASLTLYGLTGAFLTVVNRRYPDRRIQTERDGMKRVREDVRESLRALAVSAALFSAGWAAQRAGWTPQPTSFWWTPIWFGVLFLLFDAWFYWGHRLLHHPRFFRFHALHHKAVAPTAWSNDCSTPVDTLIEHGFYLLIWFLLPVPALAMIALRVFDQVTGMIGHSGFEYFANKSSRAPSPLIATTFHDLHHSQFSVNYGNFTSIWDRLMKTAHPDYDKMIARMEDGEDPGPATARNRPHETTKPA